MAHGGPDNHDERKYPALYEKLIPLALIILALAVFIVLVAIFAVVLRLF
jgi:hypothetical protein